MKDKSKECIEKKEEEKTHMLKYPRSPSHKKKFSKSPNSRIFIFFYVFFLFNNYVYIILVSSKEENKIKSLSCFRISLRTCSPICATCRRSERLEKAMRDYPQSRQQAVAPILKVMIY